MCIALWRTEGMSIALGALRAWRLQWGSTGRGVAASGSALPWRRQLPLAARKSKAAGKAASAVAQWAAAGGGVAGGPSARARTFGGQGPRPASRASSPSIGGPFDETSPGPAAGLRLRSAR
jgi:hypothetical protein